MKHNKQKLNFTDEERQMLRPFNRILAKKYEVTPHYIRVVLNNRIKGSRSLIVHFIQQDAKEIIQFMKQLLKQEQAS